MFDNEQLKMIANIFFTGNQRFSFLARPSPIKGMKTKA